MDYHLKPIGKTCAATGEPLEPGTRCHSIVREVDGILVRFDYSEEGWAGPPEGTLGQWQCIVPDREQKGPRPLDTDALMRYFEQLDEDANPGQDKFRYVLALLLLQKRRLQLDGSRTDGETEILQLSGSQGEGPFDVPDQRLTDEEVAALQSDLNAHIETEWS
jgi:hypothetical protein